MKQLLYASVLAALSFGISCGSDAVQKSDKGYSLGDNNWETVEVLTESAKNGDPMAMYVLAWAYDEGKGVEENDEVAEMWYVKAAPGLKNKASEGNPTAMVLVADMCDEGNGVPKDKKAAADWYKKAADKGDVIAIYELAECYDEGCGVDKDQKKAHELYKKAADMGHAKAKDKIKDKS